jgi:hypothetical protein
LAWFGLAWLGLAWLGLAWLGLAWLGKTLQIKPIIENLERQSYCDLKLHYTEELVRFQTVTRNSLFSKAFILIR